MTTSYPYTHRRSGILFMTLINDIINDNMTEEFHTAREISRDSLPAPISPLF